MITRQYDRLFKKYAPGLPLAFLRTLAYKESGMDPKAQAPGGGTGLMQITGIALKDYNAHNSPNYARWQMILPELNIRVGTWLLKRIVKAYAKTGIRNLQPNWDNPEFVKLLVTGWNAGWVGIIKLSKKLASRGIPVTHDNVFKYASLSGVEWLKDPRRKRWHAQVADLFYKEGGITPQERRTPLVAGPAVAGFSTPKAAAALGLAVAIGYGVWRYWR